MPPQSPYMPRSELFRVNSISEESCLPILQWAMPIIAEEPYPGFDGIGCVIVAGGKYLKYAYGSAKKLRSLDAEIPIQIWHLPGEDISGAWKFERFGSITFHDIGQAFEHEYSLVRDGWSAKIHCIKACSFRHVLLLDADCFMMVPPSSLFDTAEYGSTGMLLWPDLLSHTKPSAWPCVGLKYKSVQEHESGQILVDKKAQWETVKLATWMASHRIFHDLFFGDKELLGIAAAKLGMPSWTGRETEWKGWGMLHKATDGKPAFSHVMEFKRTAQQIPKEFQEMFDEYDTLVDANQ